SMDFIRDYFAGTTLRDFVDIALGYTAVWGFFLAGLAAVYVYVQIADRPERRRDPSRIASCPNALRATLTIARLICWSRSAFCCGVMSRDSRVRLRWLRRSVSRSRARRRRRCSACRVKGCPVARAP